MVGVGNGGTTRRVYQREKKMTAASWMARGAPEGHQRMHEQPGGVGCVNRLRRRLLCNGLAPECLKEGRECGDSTNRVPNKIVPGSLQHMVSCAVGGEIGLQEVNQRAPLPTGGKSACPPPPLPCDAGRGRMCSHKPMLTVCDDILVRIPRCNRHLESAYSLQEQS